MGSRALGGWLAGRCSGSLAAGREDLRPAPPRDEPREHREPGPVSRVIPYPAGVPAQHLASQPSPRQPRCRNGQVNDVIEFLGGTGLWLAGLGASLQEDDAGYMTIHLK